MRRRTVFAVAFLAAAVTFLTPTAAAYIIPAKMPLPATIAVERLAPSVPVTDASSVLIRRPNGLGSGFYIGNGIIVTAAHVVAGAKTVSIKTEAGRVSSAEVAAIDEKSDVAILRARGQFLPAEMNCDTVPVGTEIVAYGNPRGMEFVAAFGRIAAAPREVDERQAYITDMTTVMGQSGGAVFAGGKVIGITSAVMLAPLRAGGSEDNPIYVPSLVGFGFVVPSSVACKMVADLSAKEGA